MKTAREMLDERLTIQDGFFKGARITITEAIAGELMEDYAKDKRKGKILQSTQNLILNKMTDTEKAQFRMGCLIEAGKIKQSLNAHPEVKEYGGKGVVAIAKEFAAFVLAEV